LNPLSLKHKKLEEIRKKAIPSQVFFNHFFAISYNIDCDTEKLKLSKIEYYNKLKCKNSKINLNQIQKLLWNSWSTEYAFSISSLVDNIDYYKCALHWIFPQAYYSIYLCMTAFHETQGISSDNHESSINFFGNSVKSKHYPKSISFYCKGQHQDFKYMGLEHFNGFSDDHNVLSKINSLDEAHNQIASFLKTTREKSAESKREKYKMKNDSRFLTKKGEFRKSFSKSHWDIVYKNIPETNLLNIMYRLRIKANYHDVETFINASIDFKLFYTVLKNIVGYLNFIHEAYICKCIGNLEYEKILNSISDQINTDTAKERYKSFKQ
jgi:hypothetical protein